MGNKVNIRNQQGLNSKVIAQCNFGDKVQLLDIPENAQKLGDQKDFFYKANINGITGWINRLYVSNNYSYNSISKFYCYNVLINVDGATNENTINIYYPETKKIAVKKMNITSITFISGKYGFIDAGSDVFRQHEFIELPTFKTIKKYPVFGRGIIKYNSVIFNELKKISNGKYESTETIFENGTFKKTGKYEIINEP